MLPWLRTAIFYEIYPQSFSDSNGDGIGDIPGIINKLEYIRSLGCNALWLNPCFDSPFKDGGYDVRDYTTVAPRYGSNDDLELLFERAHQLGMRVLLDLVPGHTSEEHAWFVQSKQPEANAYSDRYIWTNGIFDNADGMPFISGESPRDAAYILNFFKSQPALNYGFGSRSYAWQQSPDSPAANSTKDAMMSVMRFWLSRGCDGFRVDMADSLVKKDDGEKSGTIRVWQQMLRPIRKEFPDAAFVAEWGRPWQAFKAGFDMDFYLDWRWNGKPNGYSFLVRNTDDPLSRNADMSFFARSSPTTIAPFLADYLPQYYRVEGQGAFCFITGNHDSPRLAPRLDPDEIAVAYAMFLTMPGIPFIYYGDEIGMRYQHLQSLEGGYHRTGSRTPMQWNAGRNRGFSTADPSALYLPTDPSPDAPTVESQNSDPKSLLNMVKRLISLRHASSSLNADAAFSVVAAPHDSKTFAYRRGEALGSLVIALNAGDTVQELNYGALSFDHRPTLVEGRRATLTDVSVTLEPSSFAILSQ
ncbi:alpha-amylase family glycosyl hydrolase [Bifidobacterium aquikefiricola]|uniref:Alpha-amylase family glycosyl hydrolase n=1 Tax=Bifidobacterium aquikefiricola TaxID=3059038 RepID=A0AB39U6X2_9BIFI